MAKRKTWSKIIEAHGVKVQLIQRGGTIHRRVNLGERVESKKKPGVWYTKRDERSLGHGDRALAEKQARALCEKLAESKLAGTTGTLTLGQLHAVYVKECGRLLSVERHREVAKAFGLLKRHLGADFAVGDLGSHQVETYVAARQGGTLKPEKARNAKTGVGAGVITKELGVLRRALNWASTFKKNGKPLIDKNPLHNVKSPEERNPKRPVATRERFEKVLEQADGLDNTGRFRTMLQVAWFTGRRLGAIVNLRVADLHLTPEAVRRALADAGMDVDHWSAAISWSAEADKEGVAWIVPIPESLRSALDGYVKARGLIGEALLFPAVRDPAVPVSKETAFYWLKQAEKRAGLPHQARGGWHALRRAWATARKHMPLQDVMAAGGWRDPASLQRAYQHADAATVLAVMEVGT